ncbi:hypothetical protein [Enteractinococcus helveticum]|uniref:Uncharacterized protein n=1 Tax=Enteractinococcus helveticum TaxID=1837282 RepID=A0A1B7M271_9MICC|nr:hypothetical protein [Enteractinococcus helveticum]OAV62696.1 hypothetical protein A6F49_04940 [Enteractinococcus helveticum]
MGVQTLQGAVVDSSEESRPEATEEILLENDGVDPDIEAAEVGEIIEVLDADPELPMLTVYEPRILEGPLPGENGLVDEATAVFPVPNDCSPSIKEASLACSTGPVDLSSTVIDSNGEFIPVEISADLEEIFLTSPINGDLAFPLVFTIYLAESQSPELLDTAEETLAWMISEDQGPGLSQEELDAEELQLNEEAEAKSYTEDKDALQLPEAQPAVSAVAYIIPGTPVQTLPKASITVVPASTSRPRKVTIPSNYRYCPNTCKPKARHDYCTSPAVNYWGTTRGIADFRGPCARHDMMIANIAKKKISLSTKKTQRRQGDLQFRANLQQNCRNGFYTLKQAGSKASCFAASGGYYAAVAYTTSRWNGK